MPGIVIIEDDDQMRGLMAEWLIDAGYPVRPVTRSMAKSHGKATPLIVDVYMPRRLGAQRLDSARSAHPGSPIIAISGQFRAGLACPGAANEALAVDRMIAKPFDLETLLEAVRAVIGPANRKTA